MYVKNSSMKYRVKKIKVKYNTMRGKRKEVEYIPQVKKYGIWWNLHEYWFYNPEIESKLQLNDCWVYRNLRNPVGSWHSTEEGALKIINIAKKQEYINYW